MIEAVKKPFKDAAANKDLTEEEARIKVMGETIGNKGVEAKINILNEVRSIYNPNIEPVKDINEYDKIIKTLPSEQKDLIKAKEKEKGTLDIAKVGTAPVRFTAGALATGVTSYALEG